MGKSLLRGDVCGSSKTRCSSVSSEKRTMPLGSPYLDTCNGTVQLLIPCVGVNKGVLPVVKASQMSKLMFDRPQQCCQVFNREQKLHVSGYQDTHTCYVSKSSCQRQSAKMADCHSFIFYSILYTQMYASESIFVLLSIPLTVSSSCPAVGLNSPLPISAGKPCMS